MLNCKDVQYPCKKSSYRTALVSKIPIIQPQNKTARLRMVMACGYNAVWMLMTFMSPFEPVRNLTTDLRTNKKKENCFIILPIIIVQLKQNQTLRGNDVWFLEDSSCFNILFMSTQYKKYIQIIQIKKQIPGWISTSEGTLALQNRWQITTMA